MRVTNLGRSSTRRARLGRLIAGLAASFAAVTCDLVTAPKAGAGSGIVVNYTGKDTLVVGTRIPLSAQVLQGAVPVEGAELRLTTADSTIIRVVDLPVGTDTIVVLKRGQARIRGTLVGVTGDDPPFAEVNITAIASSVTVDSTSVTFRNIGDTVRLRANVFDTNGVLIDSVARWRSLNNAIVSVDSITGKLLARTNGTTTVRAIVDIDTALVSVTVVQRLVRFVYSTPTLTISSLSQDTVVTVRPQDVGGTFIPDGTPGLPVPTFTSLNTGVITVARLSDTTFRVTSFANDTARVRIQAGTVDTTLFVTVGQLATSVVIQGANADTIDAVQDTTRLRARAFDGRGIEVQSRSVIWTSLNTAVVTVDANGLVTGQTLGNGMVTARLDAALDTVPVVVRNVPTFIRTSQSVSLFTVGDSITLADTVLNKLGAALAGVPVHWRSLDATVASVDSVLGVVVARAVGNTGIVGSLASGAADTTLIAVNNVVATVDITPDSIVLASVTDTVTVAGQFRNARGGQLAASSVAWRTSVGGIVSVSNGFVTALTAGTDYVIAFDSLNPNNPARRDSVRIRVTNTPASLQLTQVTDTLRAVGQTLRYAATVFNTRGDPVAGAGVRFRALNPVARIDSISGLATTQSVGLDTIIAAVATSTGITADTAFLRVFNDVVSLNVSPTAFTIPAVLDTVRLSASATNSLGGSVTGVAFTWASSNTAVASVDATGLVTGLAAGQANITVSFGALQPAQSVINVANPPTLIDIQAPALTLASINDTVAPTVTLQNALGASLGVASALWSSDNPAVASVNNGTVVAQSRGTTFIRAQSPSNAAVRDSIAVTVTNAPASIAVLPKLDSLASLGRTLTYTATIRNARGDLIPGDVPAWTSTRTAIATINASGIATAVGTGVDTIIGTAGTRADTAELRVTNIAATVQISPAAASLVSIGQTTLLTVTARNALGNAISGPVVTWQTSNAAVVSVSAGTASSNTITATGTGSATVTATVDGISNSITVSVSNPPTTVAFTSGTVTLASIGDQATPAITLTNSLGATLPRSAATWTSSDPNVFTVSATGVVTAVAAGTATLTAASPANASLNSSVSVVVTNAPATLTINPAGPTTLTAIGATVNLSATVKNAAGAVIASPVPAVSWSSNSAAVTVGAASGVATAAAPVTGAIVTATAGAATLTTTINVAPVASPAQSTIGTSAASIVANGVSTATITVRLKDAGGANLVSSGGTVTLTLTGPGTLGSVTDHLDGSYTATLTAPAALGSASVGAAVNGVAITTGNPSVSYVAGAATRYIVTTSNATPVAGGAITVTAQLVDASNNPVTTPVKTVTWSSTGGGSFGAPTSLTDASGIATVSFTTGTASGAVHNVIATDNTALTGTSANVTTIAGAPAKYLVTPGVASTIPLSGVSITAQLADANNNPVSLSGRTVTWGSTNGGSFSSPTSLTNAAGVASVTFTVSAASGTVHSVTGTDGSALTGNTTVTVTAPNQYLVSSSSFTPQAGSQVTITAQLADASNNPVMQSGQTVNWSKTGAGGSLASATSVTNASGVASVAFTVNSVANTTHTVTATDNLGFTGTSANIVTGAGPATQLVFSVQPGTATVGTGFGLTVTAQDANSNTASGFNGTVTLTITAGTGTAGAVLTGGSMTATNGVAVFSGLTIDKAGSGANQYRLTASINAGAITQNSNLFTVNNPAPTLASLTPAAGDRLQTLDVVFTGTGFLTGVTTVNLGAGFTLNSTTVNSATQLTANITVLSTATTGAHNFSVTNPTPGGGTSGNQTFTVSNPAPTLTLLAPTSGNRLQTLNVVFTGTGFITGVSSVNVGANITVNSTTVNSATQITANITIASTAATGARNFSVTNSGPGGGTSGNQSFTVNNPAPTVTNAAPASGVQAQTGLDVVLTGTQFISGVTSVSFANPSITVNTTTVNSTTSLTVNIDIGAGAATGAGNVTVTNAAPGGGSATLTNGFTVNAPAVPTLTSLAPAAGALNQTLDVVFTGTGFASGVSTVNVGANITVNTVTVNSATQLTANLTIGAAAATGARNFSVTNTPAGGTSGNQTFTVNYPVPTLTGLAPATGSRLQTLDVVFTGTGFFTGASSVNVGSNITVNTTTVNSSTQITANITIGAAATTGARNFSVTNGTPGGGTSGNQTFTISNPAPTVTNAAPNSGVQGQTGLDVVLTGTNFVAGATTASFANAGISVNSTTVNSGTQLTVNISIGAGAATGAGDITVTTSAPGGGSATLTNGFTVNAPAVPTLTSLGTTAADRLQTLDVVFTGTGFVSGVSTVNVGAGITVNTTTVNSPTQLTANLTIGAAAATGARNFSVTNTPAGGTSGNQSFTVNNPAPTVTNAAPSAGVQGQTNLDVVLTGTGFITGVSSVTFANAGVTVNTTTVNSGTQITVNVSIGAGATTGAGDVTVTNAAPGGGSATLTNGFTVNTPAVPTLASLAPASGAVFQTLDVVFTGTGFAAGVSSVNVGADITVNSVTVNSSTQLTANITIGAAAVTGARNFSVTNTPAGGTSGTRSFTVNNPVPTLTNVSPTITTKPATAEVLTLTGTGFITGVSTVNFSSTQGLTNIVVTVNSATQITVTLDVSNGSNTGPRTISVTNATPGGGTSGTVNWTIN